MSGKKNATPSTWVDPDDAPDLTDQFEGERLVRRGRPKAEVTKQPVKLRLDPDVLAALRASGDGWQTRVNEVLRASLRLGGRV